jgi:hypothetical protein
MSDWQRNGTNWAVSIDESKNRLYLELAGHIDEAQAEAAADATIEGAERLDDGFDLINDLSDFQPGDPEAMKHIERGKKGIAKNGVSAVVRVMAESTTGQMQFDRAGEDEESYQLAMADSREKAEKLLDKRREQEA